MRRELSWLAGTTAAGLVIASIYAWPGLMTYDSMVQLGQARSGAYTDWHPPIMSALWGVLDRIVSGPALMFVVQIALFVAGTYVLLRRRTTPRAAAIWSLLVLAFPPTLSFMTVVVKDSLMCGALLAGTAALTAADRRVRIAGLVAFALAAALRYNAFAAVIPMIAWLSPWPARFGTWRRRAVGAAIGIAVAGTGMLANRALAPEPAHLFELGLVPEDIVGTLAFAPDLDDTSVRELLDGLPIVPANDLQAHAREAHNPDAFPLDIVRGPTRFFDEPTTDVARATELAVWKRVMRAQFGAYLECRGDRFRWLLGLVDGPWEPVWSTRQEHVVLHANQFDEIARGPVQRWLGRKLVAMGRSSLAFRPYAYLVIAIALVIVRRRDALAVALQLGTFGYLAGLFFVAPAPDFRYAQWLIVTALVGFALHIAQSTTPRESGTVAAA